MTGRTNGRTDGNTRTAAPAAEYLHMLQDVVIEEMGIDGGMLVVYPLWRGVDRAHGTGYGFHEKDMADAERLKALILRGDAYSAVDVMVDTDGRSYVADMPRFSARSIKRDLARLGI